MNDFDDYIEGLKGKSEEAFEYIYHETKHSVYAMILSIVRDRSLTEDVMQDTYIKMLSSINSYQKGKSFRNWLLTIARNQAIDYYRKHKKEVLMDTSEDEYLLPQQNSDTMNKMRSEELLGILTEEEREIVLLRIVDNIKHRDIARIVDKPLGTVLWLYQKAIRKMQKYERGE
jgi:RNA polymerase sigma-70 factor (ECF subfamily)